MEVEAIREEATALRNATAAAKWAISPVTAPIPTILDTVVAVVEAVVVGGAAVVPSVEAAKRPGAMRFFPFRLALTNIKLSL